MRKTREKKGITLIALIITIVVLLILAVVAINAVTGDGIIQHATNARTEYESAQEVEQIQLALNEWSLLKNTPNNQETLTEFLEGKSEELHITVEEDGDNARITTESGATYKATKEGKLIKIIVFYVENIIDTKITFYAEEGMTWQEFVDSAYNNYKDAKYECYCEINIEKWGECVMIYATEKSSGTGLELGGAIIQEKIVANQTYEAIGL